MAGHPFFRYIRLKVLVSALRVIVNFFTLFAPKPRLPKDVQRRTIRIPSRDKGRFISAYLYTLKDKPATGKTPVLLNWHGSGFVIDCFGTDSEYCARVVHDTGIPVIDADYRKAPETPFPGAVDDVEDALRWVAAQTSRFDAQRVGVSGFSAGGNLALVASSVLRKDLPEVDIQAVVAFYPVTNVTIDPAAKQAPKPKKPIPPSLARFFNRCYAPDPAMRADPRMSPSLADPASYPANVAIFTCDGDNLAAEANSLAESLQGQGRHVVHRMLDGVAHAFDKGCKEGSNEWDQREIAYSLAIESLREIFKD
ncbi:hypothetical protein jhhlp_006529 [Lomentospora prolificans]|uniref:Alpha/beta hydrolase fold-3 domain-containing protein n=1 Tax=Lomentospora prolificans TaxID=41688 RepID=A0A2N3N651_9PEZI|nr:hypothetical protein jhhlp_006529 [Lomentospora prolificans]